MKKLNFAILLSIFLCWNNAQAEDIFGNSELEFVTEDETVSEDTSWRRKDDEDNKFLSSFLSSKITASTAKNINDAEKIFCYTVDYAPADYKGYLINDLALKGSCGEISETGKSLFKNTLFNNNSAYSNNIESCNISPKIMLRFVNGIDYTDVLLSTPCHSLTFFHGRDITTVNAAPGKAIIEQIVNAYMELEEKFLSPALLGQMVPNGHIVTQDQKEIVRKMNASNENLKKWGNEPKDETKNTPKADGIN